MFEMCIRFFTSVCFCSSAGYSVTEGVKLEAHGGFYVQRAEETRLWRRFPLAVAVHRLTRCPLSTLTRFTVRPAHQRLFHTKLPAFENLVSEDYAQRKHVLKKKVTDVLCSSCPHASQRLGSESLVCLFKTEHVKKKTCDFYIYLKAIE